MASLQASTLLLSSSSSSSCSRKINAAISSCPKTFQNSISQFQKYQRESNWRLADRVEMHANIREHSQYWSTVTTGTPSFKLHQHDNSHCCNHGCLQHMGMMVIMNKIQPSQLAEEQRNATRLFKQLQTQIQTMLAIETPTQEDVKDVMEKVLALDKAYPLPLLGTMLEKFPEKFEPAVWWPSNQVQKKNKGKQCNTPRDNNGWSEELEMEMREIIQVVKRKDIEDYVRLGNLGLKLNKVLAISGPLLTGIAAIGSAFVGNGSCAAIVAVAAGALASVVNSFEHGGQVGMVIEMYRNCGGFFQLMEESIEATLEERDLEKKRKRRVV
uniref:F-box protein n=1 Tax=Fagus sylvatica TaxID=28930 RepID=A0A2N9HK83_FAGSY